MHPQVNIQASWYDKLLPEFEKPYFAILTQFVKKAYQTGRVYPPGSQIFRAFDLCPFDQVKVVILGQDPYHGPDQANGLCFSVNKGVPFPPSLINIFQERKTDLGEPLPDHGDLSFWAKQGVLLLNSTLTVATRQAGSHQNQGWEVFTDAVVQTLAQKKEHLVFILWGSYAQRKGAVIDPSQHLVIQSAHPSPFSAHRGFFGSRPFGKANDYLIAHQRKPIQW